MRRRAFDTEATTATLMLLAACAVSIRETDSTKIYTYEFVVRLPGKTSDEVKQLAELHGYTYLAPMNFDDPYHVRRRRLVRRSLSLHPDSAFEPWHERIQQEVEIMTKRDSGITQEERRFRELITQKRAKTQMNDPKWSFQ